MIDMRAIGAVLAERLSGPLAELRYILEAHTGNSSASADALERIADCVTVLTLKATLPDFADSPEYRDEVNAAIDACVSRVVAASFSEESDEESDNADD